MSHSDCSYYCNVYVYIYIINVYIYIYMPVLKVYSFKPTCSFHRKTGLVKSGEKKEAEAEAPLPVCQKWVDL